MYNNNFLDNYENKGKKETRVIGADGKSSLVLSGIQVDSRLPGFLPGHLNLGVDNLHGSLSSGLEFSAKHSRLSLASLHRGLHDVWSGSVDFSSEMQLGALDAVLGREISAPYRYFPMTEPLRLHVGAEFTAAPETGSYSAQGNADATATLTMNGHPVPISLAVRFRMPDLSTPVTIEEADARMGDDHVTLYGNITGLTEGAPLFKGRADIHHFSLTRWFGFGRLMDPGLQYALDSITGSFEGMELSPGGIIVPRLRAVVQGIPLEGEGSCREFLKPDILISAHAKQADLNRIFPELSGHVPDMSHLPPPVLPHHEAEPEETPSGHLPLLTLCYLPTPPWRWPPKRSGYEGNLCTEGTATRPSSGNPHRSRRSCSRGCAPPAVARIRPVPSAGRR